MRRIAGVDIPEHKKVEIALTKIYGIGRKNVMDLLSMTKIDKNTRVKDLSDTEVSLILKILDKKFKTEGDLKSEVNENIKRLKQINSYKGLRHSRSLPARGQRTRSNARTRRGKRQTVGAMRKEMREKMQQSK